MTRTAAQRYAVRTIPIALIAIACWTCVIANAVLELFVKSRLGALGSRMNANQMISATSIPSAIDVAPATPMTHRRNVAPMMEITNAMTKPGAGFPASSGFIPSAAIQRRPKSGGENQTAPMIHALTPASTIAIQLKLDTSKDTTASDPRPGHRLKGLIGSAACPSHLTRFPPLAHQEHFADVLRVFREIDEGRREVGPRDAVRAVREILPPGLSSDPARLGSIREIRRPDDGPIGLAGPDQALHPSEVRVGLPQDPADEVDSDPGMAPLDGGDAHRHEAPDAGLAHRLEFGACDVAHDGCGAAAFHPDDRDDRVLPGDRTPDV